jgi:hypothetical protein
MGLVLNPVAFRIGHFHSWTDAWFMHRMYYPEFLHNVLLLKTLMLFLFYDLFFMEKYMYFLYSHMNLFFKDNRIFAGIHVYDCTDRGIFYKWLNFLDYDKFDRTKLKTFWLKNNLLKDNDFSLDLFAILKSLNIHLDHMVFENIGIKHSWRLKKKIEFLKKKYGDKFIAREEIYMLERLLLYFKHGFKKFGTLFAIRYYFKWYFFKKNRLSSYLKKNKYNVKKKNIVDLNNNYMFLFIILSMFEQFLIKSAPGYPYVYKYGRLENMYAIRFFHYWFVLRGIYFSFSKFVELIFLKFGMKVYCRFFILTNLSITALFIARFIALGIYSRFSFRDLMIPIRKTLHRLMYVRIFKRIKKDLLRIEDTDKMRSLEKNFNFNKKILLTKLNYLLIFLLIKVNTLRTSFKSLYLGIRQRRFITFLLKKDFKFLKFNRFFNFLFNKQVRRKFYYLRNNKFLLKTKLKKNLISYENKIFFNKFIFFRRISNIFLIFVFSNFKKILSYFLNFKLNTIYYLLKRRLADIKQNVKFFYFSFFLNFFNRLYLKVKFAYRNRNIYYYRRKLFRKFLSKKRMRWNFIFAKNHNNDDDYLSKNEIISRVFSKYKKKLKKPMFIEKIDYLKYRLINLIFNKKTKIRRPIIAYFLKLNIASLRKIMRLLKIRKKQLDKYFKKYYSSYIKKKKRMSFKKARIRWKRLQARFSKKEKALKKIRHIFLNNNKRILKKRDRTLKFLKVFKINLFYFNLLSKYSTILHFPNKKFPLKIKKMFNYIDNLSNIHKFYFKKYDKTIQYLENKHEENQLMTPLKYKLKRRKYLDRSKAILYGYKFHFKGRFKRKQKASNLWFVKGAMPNSTMIQDVDRGFFTFYSAFGACTVRVWLYKGDNSPKYMIRVC